MYAIIACKCPVIHSLHNYNNGSQYAEFNWELRQLAMQYTSSLFIQLVHILITLDQHSRPTKALTSGIEVIVSFNCMHIYVRIHFLQVKTMKQINCHQWYCCSKIGNNYLIVCCSHYASVTTVGPFTLSTMKINLAQWTLRTKLPGVNNNLSNKTVARAI